MSISASKLREDIYNVLDSVLETGIPVEIIRRGKTLKIVSTEKKNKLANLKKRDNVLNCDPEDIVHMEWPHSWKK